MEDLNIACSKRLKETEELKKAIANTGRTERLAKEKAGAITPKLATTAALKAGRSGEFTPWPLARKEATMEGNQLETTCKSAMPKPRASRL